MRKAFVILAFASATACKAQDDFERWALPDFMFMDMRALGRISITGTLKGKVGYPVNTWHIDCIQQDMICHVADVSEIGHRQLGEIFLTDWAVTSWTDNTVTLDEGDPTSCAHNVMIINRVAKSVAYSSAPQNQDKAYCKGYNKFVGTDPKAGTWEIGQPVQPWEKG
jgi:hypothetical protein